MKNFLKAFLLTFLLLTLAFVGVTGYFLVKSHVQNPVEFIEEMQKPEKNIQFLLLGVDSLKSKEAENTRSDTIMLVNFNMERGNINIVSVPRDTRTSIKGRKYKEKINHSYNYGGAELTLNTVNELLGTDIKYYLTVDYTFVKDIVNTIGGVTVDVPMDMKYEDPTATPPLYIDLKKGTQRLNGDEALQFLRFRKGYIDQDLGRVQAQQQFVSAFIKELKNPKNIIKVPSMLNSYDRNTQSNMPLSAIGKMGLNMRSFSSENINTTTLPGEPKTINHLSYVILNEAGTEKVLKEMGFK